MSNQQQPKQESEQIVKVLESLACAAGGGMPSNVLPTESLAQPVRLSPESAPKPEQPLPICEKKTCRLSALLQQLKRLIARLFNRER